MKQLYFVRHGLSQLGKQGLWAGSSDTPLAPEGRDQAKQSGQKAGRLGIDYIVCSPLSRAHETANIIATEIGFPLENIEVNNLARERDFGPLEGTAWDPTCNIDLVEGAEPRASVLARAQEFWTYLQTIDADTVLVVGHGAFGRALRHTIYPDKPFDNTGRFENAQIVQLL